MSLLVKPWLAEHPDAWFQRGREGGGGTGRGKDQLSCLLASPHLLWWGWWLLSHRHDILMIKIMMALSGPGDQWSCVLFSHHLPWSMHYDDNDINDEETIDMMGQSPRCLEKTVWWLRRLWYQPEQDGGALIAIAKPIKEKCDDHKHLESQFDLVKLICSILAFKAMPQAPRNCDCRFKKTFHPVWWQSKYNDIYQL